MALLSLGALGCLFAFTSFALLAILSLGASQVVFVLLYLVWLSLADNCTGAATRLAKAGRAKSV